MDQAAGEHVNSRQSTADRLGSGKRTDPPKATGKLPATVGNKSSLTRDEQASTNGLLGHDEPPDPQLQAEAEKKSTRVRASPRSLLRRPLSLDVMPQRARGSLEPMADRRVVQPPWRSGPVAPAPPTRSLTSPSLSPGSWMRRSESSCSVNNSLGLRASKGRMRPATSLPHIPKGALGGGGGPLASGTRPCLLVALRPLNLEQERQAFFRADYKYEPQFEYAQPEPSSVLEKYKEGSGLFLQQVGPPSPQSLKDVRKRPGTPCAVKHSSPPLSLSN